MSWYDKAVKTTKGNSAGPFTGGPFKGVLHTTEGSSASGAIVAFTKNNSWPHFLVDYNGKVWQFIDTNQAARALRNLTGGVQTNTDSAIQIEIVGFAGKPNEHPPAQVEALKELMRWIEKTSGVKPHGPTKPWATAYGQNKYRYTNQEWDSCDHWVGHCHVPENDHWDPGFLENLNLFPPPGFTVPESYFTEGPFVPFTITREQGGYIAVGGDGGVFSYEGAPFLGSLPGLNVQAKIVAATWTMSGDGYWLLGDDGAVFGFGDADYSGGFNALPPEVRGNRKPVGIVAKGNGYRIVALDPSQDGSPFDGYDFGV